MRVNRGRLTAEGVQASLQSQIDHYLAGGDLLPTAGWSFVAEANEVLAAIYSGDDPQPAIDAAWAAYHERYPEA